MCMDRVCDYIRKNVFVCLCVAMFVSLCIDRCVT